MRIVAVLTLVFSFLAAPQATARVFDPQVFTLGNGMRVVVIENHRAPVVTHMVWYGVGSADEPPGKSGIAHALEHLMFKGTPRFPDGAFSDIVARNGGNENAFTSWDYTGYYQNVAADRLALVMEMEADRMTNLTLTDAVIQPELQVILEERRQRIDNNPGSRLREQMRRAFYRNHPYGRPIIGWAHEVAALSREDILAFYKQWYTPTNATLVVAGDVVPDQVIALAEKYYGVIPATLAPSRIRPSEPPHEGVLRVQLADPRVRQPSWIRTFLADSATGKNLERVYALQVLEQILAGTSTSRLSLELERNGGPAVAAGANYNSNALDTGAFEIYASPRRGVDLETLEDAVEATIDKLLANGVTPEEVARAKKQLISLAAFARDSQRTGANVLGSALVIGLPVDQVEDWPDRIEAVTTEAVNAAARAVLRRDRAVTGLLESAS
ncbi:MAG: M16 family metallopeptidase [Magnetospiraceae bacterium]